jgi:outer membrane protein assembly factor BamB
VHPVENCLGFIKRGDIMKHNSIRPTSFILITFMLVFGICTTYVIADEYDWPRWRGPNGDGISLETDWNPEALEGGPNILWKVDVGVGYSNVAIKDNRLYTMGRKEGDNHVFCLNAETGEVIWRYSFESRFIDLMSTPIVDDNRVYILSGGSVLLCLKTKNGKALWERDLEDDFDARKTTIGWATSPVVEGNLLLLNANTKEIALNKKNGKLVWSIDDEVPSMSWGSYTTTVVSNYDGTRVALFLGPSTLNAVEVTSGKKLWSYKHDDYWHPVADPIVFGNKIFISLPDYCVMLDITGNGPWELWNNTELNTWSATAVLVDGYLYGIHTPPEFSGLTGWDVMLRKDWPFRCIDAKTGTVMWEKSMKPFSLIAADGKLILLELKGRLSIVKATSSTYVELSSADVLGGVDKQRIFATSPVLYKGKIYCRNYAGDLVCIDVSK